MFVKGQMVG